MEDDFCTRAPDEREEQPYLFPVDQNAVFNFRLVRLVPERGIQNTVDIEKNNILHALTILFTRRVLSHSIARAEASFKPVSGASRRDVGRVPRRRMGGLLHGNRERTIFSKSLW